MAEEKVTQEKEEEKEQNFFQKLIAKIKKPFQNFAAANPYLKQTTMRINIHSSLYGRINVRLRDGDFKQGSYFSILDGKGIIYGTSQEDYIVEDKSIVSIQDTGSTVRFKVGNDDVLAACLLIEFKDGRKAEADIIVTKLEYFRNRFVA